MGCDYIPPIITQANKENCICNALNKIADLLETKTEEDNANIVFVDTDGGKDTFTINDIEG